MKAMMSILSIRLTINPLGCLMKRFFIFSLLLLLTAGCAYEISSNETEATRDDAAITVIRSRFETPDTKSRLSMNSDVTYASVLWSSGDKIRVYGALSGGSAYSQDFSTTDDGVAEADFKSSSWNPSSSVIRYYGFYPSDRSRGYVDDAFGVCIPSVQKAVANGVEEGMNMAYAVTSSMAAGMTFKNLPALVKFRLSGAAVSQLKSVQLVGTSVLAGDIIVSNLASGEPVYDVGSYIPPRQEATGSVVELKGSFTTEDYYYMVVFPGTSNGFSMIFQNASGEYIIKESSKTLTLTRSHIVDFGTIDIGSSFGDPAVTKYMTSTTGYKPVDIVVIPDGFTASQRSDFETLAASGIDFLFGTEPYKTFKNYFNVYFIWKASEEEGASICNDSGVITTKHNTAFGSYWEASDYKHMNADEDAVFGFVASHCPEIIRGELNITQVPVLMIINDSRYGGIAHITSNGQTYCQVPYIDKGGAQQWHYGYSSGSVFAFAPASNDLGNTEYVTLTYEDVQSRFGIVTGDWRNVLVHEFGGHSFGRLADEYWYDSSYGSQGNIAGHFYDVPYGLNVSGWYDDTKIPWKELLNKRSTLMSSNSLYGRIGKFQGADVSLFYRWRSEEISCMIDNRPYFSTWQRVLIARRITELAGRTFSLDNYLAVDDPIDPVRDVISSPVITPSTKASVPIRPMLPPPVLMEMPTPKPVN